MLPFHRRLAEIGLAAIAEFGFVLAGGYAISANGMGDRPSEDIDMFTNRSDPDEFASAVERLREAYLASGLQVEDLRIRPTFADFHVTDPATGETSNVQLGLDFRAFPPATLDIGPCLTPVTRWARSSPLSGPGAKHVTTSTPTPSLTPDDSAMTKCSPSPTSSRQHRSTDRRSSSASAKPAGMTKQPSRSTA